MTKDILKLIELQDDTKSDFKVILNLSLDELKNMYKNPTSNSFIFNYKDTKLIISERCSTYIDTSIVWINPHVKYTNYYSYAHRMPKSKLNDLIAAFNTKYRKCCSKIRLCTKCIQQARDIVSY